MWLHPVSFSRGRRGGGGSFMTQDSLKPQLETYPSSPPPRPLVSATPLNYVKRDLLFFFKAGECLTSSRQSANGLLSNKRCLCAGLQTKLLCEAVCRVIIMSVLLLILQSCEMFMPLRCHTQEPYCTISLSESSFGMRLHSGHRLLRKYASRRDWDHMQEYVLLIENGPLLATCDACAAVCKNFTNSGGDSLKLWLDKLKQIVWRALPPTAQRKHSSLMEIFSSCNDTNQQKKA